MTLCAAMRRPPVCRTGGRRGRITLLLKTPNQPIEEANLQGITISSHISKLEPAAFYAPATTKNERALGGPCLVGGMRGVYLQEVVRTVHMKLDLAKFQHRVVEVLITDLAKFFDVIAQDVHPIVGTRVGLGVADHLATHTEGFSYTLPLGPWQSSTWPSSWVPPKVLSRGSMQAQRRLSHSSASWTSRRLPPRYPRFASRGSFGWTT